MTSGKSRKTDPATSHAAGESIDVTPHQTIILGIVKGCGAHGCTSEDISFQCDLSHDQCWRRCSELYKKGMIHANGTRMQTSGRQARVYVFQKPPVAPSSGKLKFDYPAV